MPLFDAPPARAVSEIWIATRGEAIPLTRRRGPGEDLGPTIGGRAAFGDALDGARPRFRATIRAMPAPTIVVVQVGKDWVVMRDPGGFVKPYPTWDAATAAARRLSTAEDTSFVVAGDAATVIRASGLLGAKRDVNPPRPN